MRRGISLSLADKIQIATLLAEYGVDFIEGGWPASNPKDTAFFERTRGTLKNSRIAAFGSTRRKGLTADQDPSLTAIAELAVPVATLFGKASVFQVEKIFETERAENLRIVEESVRYLVDRGITVIVDAEQYFDGLVADGACALPVLQAAEAGGAA